MARILDEPVLRLAGLARSGGRRHIIGLSGVPGSGKTTVCTRWSEIINDTVGPDALRVLGMDGFHLSRAELRSLPNPDEAFARRGAPWTFNPRLAAESLRRLRAGFSRELVRWPGFEHGVGDPVDGAVLVPVEVPVIVVEGIYTALAGDDWDAVSGQFDEQWYLDVPWDDACGRLISRHMASWNMTEDEATRRALTNDRINAALVLEGRRRADWLVRPQG